MKYSSEDVLKYINGNELKYNPEVYEKNAKFMLEVLRLTKDKKMLQFCEESLFKDSEFLYEVMDIFKDNKLLCIKLSNEFILKNSGKYTIDVFNVALKAQEINNDRYIDEYRLTGIYLNCGYYVLKDHIIKQLDKENIDMDFCFQVIQTLHPYNEPFKRYMAKHMIDELFDEIDNLEYYVKSRFSDTSYIENIGIVQYIIDIIRGTDQDLSDYAEFHQELLFNRINELNKIMIEWKEEEEEIEDEVYEIIDGFCEQYTDISLDTCLKYISKELNMPTLLDHTFESMNEHLLEMGYEELDIGDVTTDLVDDIEKQRLLNKLKKGILLYIQNNKHHKEYEKVTTISNIRKLKKANKKQDIKK